MAPLPVLAPAEAAGSGVVKCSGPPPGMTALAGAWEALPASAVGEGAAAVAAGPVAGMGACSVVIYSAGTRLHRTGHKSYIGNLPSVHRVCTWKITALRYITSVSR